MMDMDSEGMDAFAELPTQFFVRLHEYRTKGVLNPELPYHISDLETPGEPPLRFRIKGHSE